MKLDRRWRVMVLLMLSVVAFPVLNGVLPCGERSPNRRSPDYRLADRLMAYIAAFAASRNGELPKNWDQIEEAFGKRVWVSERERDLVRRRFVFANVTGRVPHSHDSGPIEGTLVLLPVYSFDDGRSKAPGRYTVWQEGGAFATRWFTEPEIQTFTRWDEVEGALKVAGANFPAEEDERKPLVSERLSSRGRWVWLAIGTCRHRLKDPVRVGNKFVGQKHHACRKLPGGGDSADANPAQFMELRYARGDAASGRLRSFDAREWAGTVRGELNVPGVHSAPPDSAITKRISTRRLLRATIYSR
jgi:hypothetical protein